jgi:hypothetical protein
MWNALVRVMKKHGMQNVNFKGFVAICVQANFNVIITLFGSGDPKLPMENQEWTSLYHWAQSLVDIQKN